MGEHQKQTGPIHVKTRDSNHNASRYKIFSDPVHGFISVPRQPILELIHTPEVQRLRRIRQLGVGYLVFPGAEHTRFGHALGAMALMHDALVNLQEKGTPVSGAEFTAAQCAALLHDIGHGPFSHTLENVLIRDFRHEMMSREMILRLAARFPDLDLALQIFDGTYDRPFFHQLVSSQLDMDRLDYLRRDSFYTGVVEGAVGVQRIIKTMRVHPSEGGPDSSIVIDAKGTYAVENFLIARRLMYWQVYLHKTVVAGDHVLQSIITRARKQLDVGDPYVADVCSPAFLFFLSQDLTSEDIQRDDVIETYYELDDTDVLYSIKRWAKSSDSILADLCARFLTRNFFRVSFLEEEPSVESMAARKEQVREWLVATGLSSRDESESDVDLYFSAAHSRHSPYESAEDSIVVMQRDGRLYELSEGADTAAVSALRRFEIKPYVSCPRDVI